MKTCETEDFRRTLHLAKLMPLGKDSKREAVHKWHAAIKKALANSGN